MGITKENNTLSFKELQVLQLLSKGLTTKEIHTKLGMALKTVQSHYTNIKVKLNLENMHQLIAYAAKNY